MTNEKTFSRRHIRRVKIPGTCESLYKNLYWANKTISKVKEANKICPFARDKLWITTSAVAFNLRTVNKQILTKNRGR